MNGTFDIEMAVAVDIAEKAGEIMRKYFYGGQNQQIKEDGTPVTIADTEINSMVIAELEKHFPEDGVIGEEESTAEYGGGRRWFCDPIDGTRAFTWSVPTSMFSLALVVDGVPVLGVAYDPFLKDMFMGVKGQGSFRNETPLKVSSQHLKGGLMAITANTPKVYRDVHAVKGLLDAGVETVQYSSAVNKSSRIAMGNFVGYFERDVNAHDMAAVQVIVEEAGGKVTGLDGKAYDYTKPFRGTIVSNGIVHDEVVAIINASVSVPAN